MSVAVINLTTSVLEYQQWQSWIFQPWATNLASVTKVVSAITIVTSKSRAACTSHGLSAGQPFMFASLVNPVNVTALQVYYAVTIVDANTFTFAATPGGAEIATGTADSGTMTAGDTWTSSALPPGLTLNPVTGAIGGAGITAGVYVVGLQVTNTNGTSAAVYITIGIAPAAYSNHSGVDMTVDVGTGKVTLPDGLVIKEDDDLLFYITFVRNGNVIDLGTLTAMNLSLKEFAPDVTLLVGNTFNKTGSGSSTVYILYAKIESDALKASMTNYEADSGTMFDSLAELQWIEPNATSGPTGPSTLRRSSGIFNMPIVGNFLPD